MMQGARHVWFNANYFYGLHSDLFLLYFSPFHNSKASKALIILNRIKSQMNPDRTHPDIYLEAVNLGIEVLGLD